MRAWRFCESVEDANAWAVNQRQLHAVIEYESNISAMGKRRIMVVTKDWLQRELERFSPGPEQVLSTILPSLIVIQDRETLEELKVAIDSAMKLTVLDYYSTPVDAREATVINSSRR